VCVRGCAHIAPCRPRGGGSRHSRPFAPSSPRVARHRRHPPWRACLSLSLSPSRGQACSAW
jgi:hypothetical protein